MKPSFLLSTMVVALAVGCAEPNINSTGTGPTDPDPADTIWTISLRASTGDYVTAKLNSEGDDKEILVAQSPWVGEWEQFTMIQRADSTVNFRAANGMFVCSDGDRGNLLVANRSGVSTWEAFRLVPLDSGKVALQAWNGQFVTAHQGLEGARKGLLIGDRSEVKDWERFRIDTVRTAGR